MADLISSNDIRANNARKIMYELRNSPPITRKELADRLELSVPTITNISRILLSEGHIAASGSVEAAVGRKPTLLTVNSGSGYAVGLNITTHFARIVVLNFGGEVLLQDTFHMGFTGTEEYWLEIARRTDEQIELLGLGRERVLGVRLAISPLLLPGNEMSLDPGSIPGHMLDPEQIAHAFSYPVALMTPAEAAGISRYWYKRDISNTLVILLNRFIEGCLITQDPLSHLPQSRRLPLGHISLDPKGKRCFCGKRGCFQTFCSSSVITDRINGLDTSANVVTTEPVDRPLIHWSQFIEEVEAGNAEYKALFDEYLDYLCYEILNLRLLFEADVVIAGDNASIFARYRGELVRRLKELSPQWSWEDIEKCLHTSNHPSYEACVGAALSVFDAVLAEI